MTWKPLTAGAGAEHRPARLTWGLVLTGVMLALISSLAFGQDAAPPTPDKGDVAWMLTSTALVLMMAVPGLALFYGGMVRSKNVLSVCMQVFITFSLLSVLWVIYGYSIAFTTGNAFFGSFDRLFLSGVTTS